LEELVMLTQASISIVNTERRVLDRDAPALAASLQNHLRGAAYEVTVVDRFYQLAQRAFERRGVSAMWERPYPTGNRGRPLATDVSLFDANGRTETRLEFGLYARKKLRDDAAKLASLGVTVEPGYPNIRNFLLLWTEKGDRLSEKRARNHLREMTAAAAAIKTPTVQMRLLSGVDLFAETVGQHRVAYVGLFEVS
jgi:hypothetical protein